MRGPDEIFFRLKQETGNLRLLAAKPRFAGRQPAPLAGLPDPRAVADALRGTAYAAGIERLAEEILAHRFPLLGATIATGPEIDWRRDYLHGITTPARYFRFVPYLDFQRAGDHKAVWELNRHQHWVVLAQAFLLTGREEFLREIRAEFESWVRQNPFLRGINWTSALEVAFRALSWVWVYHLAGSEMESGFRARFLSELYRHGCYLERNLSVFFSPNTHLLGEAVALHALGVLFPSFAPARRWAETGASIVQAQMERQVRADGSHFEQSTYYHVYALDMFLLHQALADTTPAFREKLARMAEYLAAVMGPQRTLPFLGDDDGGRLFHPYGARDRFGRATLATCGAAGDPEDAHEQAVWWFGPSALRTRRAAPEPRSRLFPDAGLAVMQAGDVHLLVDAGPFGFGGGGHSHADTLSLVARLGAEDILIDPGTYTYVSDPRWRDWFRGTAAHNTVRIDGTDQARPAGPFRWSEPPRVEIREWASTEARDYLDAACSYRQFTHRRRVLFVKPDRVFVLDDIEGPAGEHLLEQSWRLGAAAGRISPACFRVGSRAVLLLASEGAELAEEWRSPVFGCKVAAPVVRVTRKTALPARFAAALDFSGAMAGERLSAERINELM